MEYKLTEASQNNSSRGLALAKKYSRELPESIIKKAKGLSKELSLDEVKELYKELTKLEKSYKPKTRLEDSGPDENTLAYLSLGGTSALANTRLILRQENILKSYTQEITEQELNSEDDVPKLNAKIVKSVDEEKRLATFLVLEPQDDDYTTNDLHADWYDAETVEQSCHNFNRYCRKANLLHLMDTSAYEFVESYITKSDMVLNGQYIKKGSWLATIYADESALGEEIWQGIKSGYFNGLSIQCMGTVEKIED